MYSERFQARGASYIRATLQVMERSKLPGGATLANPSTPLLQ